MLTRRRRRARWGKSPAYGLHRRRHHQAGGRPSPEPYRRAASLGLRPQTRRRGSLIFPPPRGRRVVAAPLTDNHIYCGNDHVLDPARVTWRHATNGAIFQPLAATNAAARPVPMRARLPAGGVAVTSARMKSPDVAKARSGSEPTTEKRARRPSQIKPARAVFIRSTRCSLPSIGRYSPSRAQ